MSWRDGDDPNRVRRSAPDEIVPGLNAGRRAAQRIRERRHRISTGRWVAEWIVVVSVAVLAALGIKTYVFQAYSIPSGSMLPTLDLGDRVLVSKLSTKFSAPDRGNVVVFRRPPTYRPGDPEAPTHLIKRVIGLPGERITARDGRVFVDGEALDEPWLPEGTTTTIDGVIKVPPDRLLVMGDNRGNSEDGRVFGPISPKLIEGRAVATIWPPGHIGGL